MKKFIFMLFILPLFGYADVYNATKKLPPKCYSDVASLTPREANVLYPSCSGLADQQAKKPTKTAMQLFKQFNYSICIRFENLKIKDFKSYYITAEYSGEQSAYIKSCNDIYIWYLVGKNYNLQSKEARNDPVIAYKYFIIETDKFVKNLGSKVDKLYAKQTQKSSIKLKTESSGYRIAEPSINTESFIQKLNSESNEYNPQIQPLNGDNAYIKFALLGSQEKALQLQQELASHDVHATVQTIQTKTGVIYSLRAGPFAKDKAQAKLKELSADGYSGIITSK